MTPEELAKQLEERIESALTAYEGRAKRTQRRTLNALLELTNEFKLNSGGNIKPTGANLTTNARIHRQLGAIVNDPEHQSNVEKLVSDLQRLKREMNKYMLEIGGNAFNEASKVLEKIVDNAIIATRQTLLEAGYEATIVTELETMLTDNVTNASRFRDLVGQVTDYMIGTPELNGRLVRYSKLFVNDTMNQFVRNYLTTAAVGIDVEFYEYSGGLVADSREFCVTRNGKVWHIEEIREWGYSPAKWQGRNRETNSSNIVYLLGGYNCFHHLIPRLAETVPESDRIRIEGKGLYKWGSTPAPTTGKGKTAPDGFTFAPDVKDVEFTYGQSANIPKGFKKTYGIDLPDQLWDANPRVSLTNRGGGAYYNPITQKVNVETNRRYTGGKGSGVYRRQVFAHELGHRQHFQNKIITDSLIDDDNFNKLWNLAQKEIADIKEKFGNLDDYIYNINAKDYKSLGHDFGDVSELLGSFSDTVQALTKGRYGRGHTKKYMNTGNNRFMEFFAHANENFWIGNPIFKEKMPETYAATIEYIKNLNGL